MFEFLFKYRPVLFQEGDLVFRASWPVLIVLLTAGVLATVAVVTYGRPGGRAAPRDRVVLGGLRLAALGVLVFCLFQPSLVLTSVVPQRNFVGVLVDDSRSMTLPDMDGRPRRTLVDEQLGGEAAPLLDALAEKFSVRMFRFSSATSRIDGVQELGYRGTRTSLADALDHAREELSAVPLSGLVVMTDGADNGGRPLEESLVPLQAAGIPVFTVGLGEETLTPDVQLGRVSVPRSVLQGTALAVDVVVAQRGFRGRSVQLVVEDEDRILDTRDVTLPADGEPTIVRVQFTADRTGPRLLRFRVPVQEGERVAENNRREVVLDVRGERQKVLYFEGEPRYEVGFLRRAVREDENLQVVVLQRTAENKFLRLDVDDGDELAGGFPKTREELFRYRGLILGSAEASFFTHDQLAMIADFVGERGGGLLALGGRNALAEGGYAGTPVAEALPVQLEPPASDPRDAFVQLQITPTVAGRAHPATRIAVDEAASLERWATLPPLSTMNRIVTVKPGATVLLQGAVEGSTESRVVLAQHRYGRGKAAAFAVQDSWLWQMHADIPLEDLTHETLWRQLLRWLVDGVTEPVEGALERERVEAGEAVEVRATVRDSSYLEVNDARVMATISGPEGDVTLPLEWTVQEDGIYTGRFTPAVDGFYQVGIVAYPEGTDLPVSPDASGDAPLPLDSEDGPPALGVDVVHLRVGPGDEEYFDAAQRTALLQRVAEETGGRYYTSQTLSTLPEDLTYSGSGVTLVEERDLWDMPILFLLLVGLVGAEWGYRRRRGLV